ncbi:MAG: hypothetical protein QW303_02700 [Nitrososphaerota archaeon]
MSKRQVLWDLEEKKEELFQDAIRYEPFQKMTTIQEVEAKLDEIKDSTVATPIDLNNPTKPIFSKNVQELKDKLKKLNERIFQAKEDMELENEYYRTMINRNFK